MITELRKLDTLREEYRFSFLPDEKEALINSLGKNWKEISFSTNPVTLTLYLDNDEHDVPFGISVKLRNFLPFFYDLNSDKITEQVFRLETKLAFGISGRRKNSPEFTTISGAIKSVETDLRIKCRPYLAVQYRRRHFIPKENNIPARITIDSEVSYWFFDGTAKKWVALGQEEICRLEVKISKENESSKEWIGLRDELSKYAFPSNSKKNEGYARIGFWLVSNFAKPLTKDLRGYEIEAKLDILSPNQQKLFGLVKEWSKKLLFPFVLIPHFPFTLESESINRYWAEKRGGTIYDGLKILIKGGRFSAVLKDEYTVLDGELGIIKRSEIKIKSQSVSGYHAVVQDWLKKSPSGYFLGELRRRRRAIWVFEKNSGRIYHITLDNCQSLISTSQLWQLEIEYVGTLKEMEVGYNEKIEELAVQEIRFLVRSIIKIANQEKKVLAPSTLTKFQWLLSSA